MKIVILFAAFASVALCQIELGNGTDPSNSTSLAPSPSTTIVPGNSTDPSPSSNSTIPITSPTPGNGTEPSNSTTPAPTKPTSPAKPTTVPTPPTPDETVNVTVSNGSIVCISMTAQMSLQVNYNGTTRIVNVPSNAVMSGNCSLNDSTQSLDITFNTNWKIGFIFSKDKNGDVTISKIDITYDLSSATEAAKTETFTGNFFKSGSQGNYYLCNSNTTIAGNNDVTLTTTNLKYKAFNENKEPGFKKSATECAADEETSSVVPIAVGAALAGLVVIVLIAYLIGRRRSRQTGYESV